MIRTLLESVGGKLVDAWSARLLTPAFAFWFLGGILLTLDRGWPLVTDTVQGLTEGQLITLLALAVLSLVASALVVERFTLPLLRLAAGQWNDRLSWPRDALARRHQEKRQECLDAFQRLHGKGRSALTEHEKRELARVEARLARMPRNGPYLPTRLGNLLRAAEERPGTRYGLDAAVCWPRLWLVLPEQARNDVKEAQADLHASVQWATWSVLFATWTLLHPAALIVSLLGLLVCRAWAHQAAATYADLFVAAFDVHRTQLYAALRWPAPRDPQHELRETGPALTQYLWRGSDKLRPVFRDP